MKVVISPSGKQGKHTMLHISRMDEPEGQYFKAAEGFVYLTFKEWAALETACQCTREV